MSGFQNNSQCPPNSDFVEFTRPKLGWTLHELASSLSVSVPFLRLELKRGRLKAAHLGRRVIVLDAEVHRYLAQASTARVDGEE